MRGSEPNSAALRALCEGQPDTSLPLNDSVLPAGGDIRQLWNGLGTHAGRVAPKWVTGNMRVRLLSLRGKVLVF